MKKHDQENRSTVAGPAVRSEPSSEVDRAVQKPYSENGPSIDADEFAAIIGGVWEVRPARNWRYVGLCYHWEGYSPGRIILPKMDGFRYGVNLSSLKGDMGRAGIMLTENMPTPGNGAPFLRVDSIQRAVRRLARHLRYTTETPIVAVTGSVGKTSSCYLLQHLLSHRGRVATNGQYNYPDGIVCEMANLGVADYMVIEASLGGLGEATAILKPDVAILTHVSPVHVTSRVDLLNLAEGKARLFDDLAPGGTAVINRDIPHFDRVLAIAQKTASTVVTFGGHAEADFKLMDYDVAPQLVKARIFEQEVEYELGLRGRHMAINSLGALAAGHAIGISWPSLVSHCATARSVSGRGALECLKVCGKRVSLIDDSYNASPASMRASFEILAATTPSGKGRRIAVLADMLELGDDSYEYHKQLAEPLMQSDVDKVYLAGEMMRCLYEQLPAQSQKYQSADVHGILRPLVSDLEDGDVILLKGSHGTQMHQLVRDLRYLTLAPGLNGFGLRSFLLIKRFIRRVGPYTSERVKRWVSWQVKKRVERRLSLS